MPLPEKEYYSLKELADLWDVKLDDIIHLIDIGKLKVSIEKYLLRYKSDELTAEVPVLSPKIDALKELLAFATEKNIESFQETITKGEGILSDAVYVKVLSDGIEEIDGDLLLSAKAEKYSFCVVSKNEKNRFEEQHPETTIQTNNRDEELQASAEKLAKQLKESGIKQFTKRELAKKLAVSDEWDEMTYQRIERIIRKTW